MIKFYEVGGSIRDEILGKKSKDKDFAVECESFEQMVHEIELRGKAYLIKPEYFTVRANIPTLGSTDYTLCRKEGPYSDYRHPDKCLPGTIVEDLARRDFTCNAIARNVSTGEIIDPFNGRADIEHKILRCVGNAVDRFTEDGLRILRAIRFSITKGFTFDKDIHWCLFNSDIYESVLSGTSNERIREELFKAFNYNTLATLRLFDSYKGLRDYLFAGEVWLKASLGGK